MIQMTNKVQGKEDSNRERGRENGSFPVAEILKPRGFRAQRAERASSEIPLGSIIKTIDKIKS